VDSETVKGSVLVASCGQSDWSAPTTTSHARSYSGLWLRLR